MVFIIFGGALLGGLAGAAGSIGGSAIAASAMKKEAKRNRKFQERMSNTAYQRAMDDMRKAGLNPILSYQRGGASTPSGAVAQVPDFGKAGGAAVQGALAGSAVQVNKETAANINAQAKLNSAQATKATLEANYLQSNPAAVAGRMTAPIGLGSGAAGAIWETLKSTAKDAGEKLQEGWDRNFKDPSPGNPPTRRKARRWSVDDDWQSRSRGNSKRRRTQQRNAADDGQARTHCLRQRARGARLQFGQRPNATAFQG